jgi:hypothetical protein
MLRYVLSYRVFLLLSLCVLSVACNPVKSAETDATVDLRAVACAAYCVDNMDACTGADAQYINENSCNAYCNTFTPFPFGEADTTSGNSIECRRVHSGIARDSGQTGVHCPHTGYTGGNTCGTWCQNFCSLAAQNCPSLFPGDGACATVCGSLDDSGEIDATTGNTLQCRLTFLMLAGLEGATSEAAECPKASVASVECI